MLFSNAFSSKVIIYQLSCYITVSSVLCSKYNHSLDFVEPISPDGLETQPSVQKCNLGDDRNFPFPRGQHFSFCTGISHSVNRYPDCIS